MVQLTIEAPDAVPCGACIAVPLMPVLALTGFRAVESQSTRTDALLWLVVLLADGQISLTILTLAPSLKCLNHRQTVSTIPTLSALARKQGNIASSPKNQKPTTGGRTLKPSTSS